MKTPQLLTKKIAASLVCLALLIFTGSASADNTGSGGTIVYTDSGGLNPVAAPPYIGGYVVHTFTANGTLILPSSVSADVLVVAGGGGGGGVFGCGGGAGGLVYSNLFPLSGTTSVTVGGGGSGTSANTSGANGANSVIGTLTALGGGGGGDGYNFGGPGTAGQNGGSGGGGGGGSAPFDAGTATQPSSASGGYGNNGYTSGDGSTYGGGGGAGVAATSNNGGVGLPYAISGVNTYFAGGGAGLGGIGTTTAGGGGNGGSGNAVSGGNGAANTGGGGGGGWNATGGNGGSGIVIVRYPYVAGAPTVAVTSPTNSQTFVGGSAISASALALGGSSPYSATYHYKLTTAGSYTTVGPVGPFGATNTFTQTLGALANGVYQIYATVADNAAGMATSVTNTFTVYAAGNTGLGGTITYTDPNGLNPVSAPPYVGGYVVQTFTTNGTLILPSSVSANVLLVAGGGGGDGVYGCGGGAGGLIYTNLSLSGGLFPVTVGAGGIGTAVNNYGLNGNNSAFAFLIALGGGGGGDGYNPVTPSAPGVVGQAGGSGGGGGGGNSPFDGGAATQPSSASGGYGNAGATGDGSTYGGGGGAGAAGSANNGGAGLPYAISGVTNYYAGGAGGLGGVGTTISAMGGGGEGGNNGAGGNGVANTGGGGGGGWGATGGSGASGIVIVRYPYVANPPVSVVMTSPTTGQSFLQGSSVSATAAVAGGGGPYSVTYYYKLTSAASYTATAAVGPFDASSAFTQTLGTLPLGAYQFYATVADSAAGAASSMTNTFAVSLTTGIPVQDANFETPGAKTAAPFWAQINPVWNPDTNNPTVDPYQQNSVLQAPQDGHEHFTNTCPGGVDWIVLLNANTISITQDLLASVNAGDTLSMSFYGGRGLATSSTADGGVFTAAFLVGSAVYSTNVDTTVLTNGTWQNYTLTQVITNSGDLSLQFSAVSGDPWLDNISVTRTLPSLVPVPPVLGAPKISDGNLILTGTGGTPNSGYTWLSTTNLSAPITWTTNSTGTLDGTGAFSNAIPIGTIPASFFRLRLP